MVLTGGLFLYSTLRDRTALLANDRLDVVSQTNNLAAAAAYGVASRDLQSLKPLIEAQLQTHKLRYALLADPDGQILAHTDPPRIGKYLGDLPVSIHSVFQEDEDAYDNLQPLYLSGQFVGWARLGFDRKSERSALDRVLHERIFAGLLAIGIGFALAMFVATQVSRRMGKILEAIQKRNAGDTRCRVSLSGNDEPAQLGRAFDQLLEKLSVQEMEILERQKELEDLNRHLEERVIAQIGQLDQKERMYRVLFTMAPDGYLILEAEGGRILDCNQSAETLLQGSREQILGLTPDQLSPPFQPDGLASHLAALDRIRIASEKGFHRFEWIYRKFDGTDFCVDVALFVVELSGQRSLFVSWRDISERKRLEQELGDASELNEQIIATSTIGIFACRSDGTCILANEAVAKISGTTVEQMYQLNFHQLESWKTNGLYQAVQNVLETGIQRNLDAEIVSTFGLRRWLSFSITRIHHGSDPHFLMMVVDNSERKKTEESAHRLAAIVENSGDAILRKSLDGTVESWNRAAEQILGFEDQEMIGQHFNRFVPEKARAFESEMFQRAVDGEVIQFVGLKLHREGRCVECATTLSPIYSQDQKILGVAAILRDVTIQKSLERELEEARQNAERANQAKSMFLANMSHEIRTPLHGIIGLGRMLESTPLSTLQADYLSKLNLSSKALLHILNDILDFSKIEAGHLELEHIAFSVEELLSTTSDLFSTRAREKGIELLYRVDPDVPIHCLGDPLRLGQILNNLVGNALKFAVQGEVLVRVSSKELNEEQVRLTISVSDSGIGLSPEACANLFKPFVQADGATTRRFGGTGLGLSICKSLSEKMGGSISVKSLEGSGSTFTFTVVVGLDRQKSMRNGLQSFSLLRVLVVDDQQTSREILKHMLESWGCLVTTEESGEAALVSIQRHARFGKPFRFALVDWMMPGISGIDLVARLDEKIQSGLLDEIPKVVMVTDFGKDRLLEQLGNLRIHGILTNPVEPSALFDLLSSGGVERRHADFPIEIRDRRDSRAVFSGAFSRTKVLLVEDNKINQMVAEEFFRRRGMFVDIAQNGMEALEKIRENKFDIVFMDVQMPVMDGYQATRAIRNLESEIQDIPIIAMSASAMVQDQKMCLAAGMNAHIAKPFDPDQVQKVLEFWLGGAMPQNGIGEVGVPRAG